MRRIPHSAVVREPITAPSSPSIIDPNKWANAEEAAIILRRFRRKDGKPSVGAIRNLVYRKKLIARKVLGRLLFLREELDRLVVMTPLLKGV